MSDLVAPAREFPSIFPTHLPPLAAQVADVHRQLEMFERQNPARADAILAAQLRHLLEHARRCSPFWNERLAQTALEAKSVSALLQAIPPLTRKDLQDKYDALIARFPGREKMKVLHRTSSGSTGTPVRVEVFEGTHMPLYYAALMQDARWHKFDARKTMGRLAGTVEDQDRVPISIPFRWFGPVGFGFSTCTRDRDDGELYEIVAKRAPAYLTCGPASLVALARYALQTGRNDLRPELVFTLGSAVTDEMRQIARDGLGTKIVDRYSCEETGFIAGQCPVHNHLHVYSPITHVEIVDDNNMPCPVGQPGRVLLTSMQSYAMPLIRYEIGDLAEWGEPCDCGVTLPVIKKLWGRTRHVIVNPDGRKTFARIYAREFQELAGLIEYRFVLHSDKVVVAQLKALQSSEQLTEAVIERVQRALSYPYPVKVKYVEKIDWGSTWKQENFAVSDSPSPPLDPAP